VAHLGFLSVCFTTDGVWAHLAAAAYKRRVPRALVQANHHDGIDKLNDCLFQHDRSRTYFPPLQVKGFHSHDKD